MALTGNTVASTYLDLVQLEKSGAGLPSHAGKEAALYDGSGAQILGRTSFQHWLDPHPDAAAFAETYEFSTYGDANQAALEADGWTFQHCSGEVSNGVMKLVGTTAGNQIRKAYISTTLAGDFDIVTAIWLPYDYGATAVGVSTNQQCLYVGDSGVGDTAQGIQIVRGNTVAPMARHTAAWTTLAGTPAGSSFGQGTTLLRISRVSGTVYFYCGSPYGDSALVADDTSDGLNGWDRMTTKVDATSFNKIAIALYNTVCQPTVAANVPFLRRFQ